MNFFHECFQAQFQLTEQEFRGTFCQRCKNQDCELAEWGDSDWVDRISTQVERLLTNPLFANPNDPRYQALQQIPFADMAHRAYQLEIADQKGDWEIPEILVTDGQSEVADREVTSAVDRAVKSLQGEEIEEIQEEETKEEVIPLVLEEPIREMEREPPRSDVAVLNPSEGIVLEGGFQPSLLSSEPKEEIDPWDISNSIEKVKVGATIRLGTQEKKNED